MLAHFPAGTIERMDAARSEKEPRASLVREAVERELRRRARRSKAMRDSDAHAAQR
jgi:hypothetical protein